jgi:hypothetical protein
MSNADAEQRRSPQPGERPLPTIRPGKRLDPAAALDLISTSARLLFANGQTTERMVAASEQLAEALGFRASVLPRWGELVVRIEDDAGSLCEIVAAEPAGMEMSKVTATLAAIDKICDGHSVSSGPNYHNADRRPDAATFCGARIRFGGVIDPRCSSVPNGRRNGRPRYARPTLTSGALGPAGRRCDDGPSDHLGESFGLILPKMGIQSFTQSLFHRRRQKFVRGLKSPFVAGKFGKGETL